MYPVQVKSEPTAQPYQPYQLVPPPPPARKYAAKRAKPSESGSSSSSSSSETESNYQPDDEEDETSSSESDAESDNEEEKKERKIYKPTPKTSAPASAPVVYLQPGQPKPVKYGRGRPRKDEPPRIKYIVPKRPRGRPRKVPLPLPAAQPVQALEALEQQGPHQPRKRGRPRKDSNAPHSNAPHTNVQPKEPREAKEPAISMARYPRELMDTQIAGFLDFLRCRPELVSKVLQNAKSKFAAVQRGHYKFGHPVVIKSFEFNDAEPVLPAVLTNLLLMNVLCSNNVAETRHGKVSFWPVTVYTTPQQAARGTDGYPCVAIHTSHIKCVLWRVFRACRKVVNNQTLMGGMAPVLCKFNPEDDTDLTVLAGVEQYTSRALHAMGAFMLISAKWFDIMKNFFVTSNFSRRDIGVIFRSTYVHVADKFSDEFRPLWLGIERSARVHNMIRIDTPLNDHTFSMTRCRALDKQVHVGRSGALWSINPPKSSTPVRYTDLSFAYGVQCWKEQLQLLNSAFIYFTASSPQELVPLIQPAHQQGIFALDDSGTTVKSRQECIETVGIHNDGDKDTEKKILSHMNAALTQLVKKYGQDFVANFFGPVVKTEIKEEDDGDDLGGL